MERELTLLREVCSKYGTLYLKKYFGFSLREIAQATGISKNHLSQVLSGKRGLHKKHWRAFEEAVSALEIERRTAGFKESPDQIWLKTYWATHRNLLTIVLGFCIILTMESASIFLKPEIGNAREDRYNHRRITQFLSDSFDAVAEIFSAAAFFIFNIHSTKTQVGRNKIFAPFLLG